MNKHNQQNIRIRHEYLTFLREAKRQSEASLDAAEKAICRFEEYNRHKDFRHFHHQQAIGFKKHLTKVKAEQSGKPLSKSTVNSTLNHLKAFFQWLAIQSGYKSKIQYSDAEYFHLSEKDTRVATAKREKPVPTLDQITHTIRQMPSATGIEKRDRALVAFAILTGARDKAITTFKLKHIDLSTRCLHQDAREVDTKFGKTFDTFFFPVGDEIEDIVRNWVIFLREEMLWSETDPLFPSTKMQLDDNRLFTASDLTREHWKDAGPVRRIFKDAFIEADLPYFNPHSFRNTLALLAGNMCTSPGEYKAWSQNLGHENVLTTFTSYGNIPTSQQGMIIRDLARLSANDDLNAIKEMEALLEKMKRR